MGSAGLLGAAPDLVSGNSLAAMHWTCSVTRPSPMHFNACLSHASPCRAPAAPQPLPCPPHAAPRCAPPSPSPRHGHTPHLRRLSDALPAGQHPQRVQGHGPVGIQVGQDTRRVLVVGRRGLPDAPALLAVHVQQVQEGPGGGGGGEGGCVMAGSWKQAGASHHLGGPCA